MGPPRSMDTLFDRRSSPHAPPDPRLLDLIMDPPRLESPSESPSSDGFGDEQFEPAVTLWRYVEDGRFVLDDSPPSLQVSAAPVQVEFLAEGGANICFRMILRPGAPDKSLGLAESRSEPAWVIRARKSHAAEGFTTREVYDFHQRQILPLFQGSTIVQPLHYDLVRLSRGAIAKLNSLLTCQEVQDQRRKKRTGDTVSTRDPDALLMEDFSGSPPHEFSFGFKPKWLAQSPSAPFQSSQCRNCALLAKRYLESGAPAEYQPDGVCPLNLLADSPRYVREQARMMYAKYSGRHRHQVDSQVITRRLEEFLSRGGLGGQVLTRLQCLQERHDPRGVIHAWRDRQIASSKGEPLDETRVKDLALAMTLRDCSLLLCVPRDPSKPIRACIADLDPKPWQGGPTGKLDQWYTTELALIDGGYYMRRGRYPWNEQEEKRALLCALQTGRF